MDQQTVRDHAQAHCEALLAGDVDRALEDYSDALRSSPGQLVAQFPLPLTEATVESVDPSPTGYVATLRLVGESQTVRVRTRWKDRDGQPTIVEASHVSEPPAEAAPAEQEDTAE